jgi:hypothetical protein
MEKRRAKKVLAQGVFYGLGYQGGICRCDVLLLLFGDWDWL